MISISATNPGPLLHLCSLMMQCSGDEDRLPHNSFLEHSVPFADWQPIWSAEYHQNEPSHPQGRLLPSPTLWPFWVSSDKNWIHPRDQKYFINCWNYVLITIWKINVIMKFYHGSKTMLKGPLNYNIKYV